MLIPDTKAPHIGRKIKGVRELLGMKQETLARIPYSISSRITMIIQPIIL